MGWTPFAFLAVFEKREALPSILDMGRTADAVAEHNRRHTLPKGLKPVAPSWFLPELRKR